MSKLCTRCNGTGEYLGIGMVLVDCNLCQNFSEPTSSTIPLDKVNRKSKAYNDTIKELMRQNAKLTRDDAVKLFNETYDKV